MFERWFNNAEGERASRAISEVGGRSGMVLRTSDSIRCRNSLKERQAPPSWRATWGRRSGPRRMMATTPITSSLPGSRFNMCLHSTVQLQGLDEALHPLVVRFERVFQEHCALSLVVQLEMYPVDGEIPPAFLGPLDEGAPEPGPG